MAPPAQARGVNSDATQLASWYSSLPVVTRTIVSATVIVSFVSLVRFVSQYQFGLYWPLVWNRFQIWRLVTGFFTHEPRTNVVNIIVHTIMLFHYSIDLERGEFAGRTADYAWFAIFAMGAMSAVAWLTTTMFLASGVLLAVLTLWSLHRQEQIVTFFFGFKFPARYLPYVTMALEFVLDHGNVPYDMIYGWMAAHLYYYLSVDLPSQGGLNYIPTPQLLYRFLGQVRRADARSTSSGTATSGNPIHQRPGGGHFWGTGRRMN
ncbi:hypothetical protein GGI04_002523 [Coemansia thaxteri]|uniref:Derlin n=1 Tax=Coemansia thaxteri TaxID=2663907 RepID=A0A9W8BMY6_9FUNG|nr:hypothetical protein GGI04_002523 [Coemansia thaxteri]KAJ2007103.1 hypothetical protein H4R26_000996 [Coemansia thaxteri]KAJ2471643.1 hypothetical protein GGI02_002131 [Coemansia sp. RSA 2322]KAJ2487843.1 hypothetical protein EV174_000274 [Coemansia sp. RSA 2320]